MSPDSHPGVPATAAVERFAPKASPPARRDGRIVNAMSVDVEDYFQVQAFADAVERARWDGYACRVEANTDRVLALFADAGLKATFFTLGWVAERYPALIRRIVGEGHELASHGFAHVRAFEQSPDEFRADVGRTKRLLEDTGGVEVRGYRAATFSIGRANLWALDVLADEGYAYSSSIFPVRHDLYGMPEAPRFAFFPRGDGAFEEYPMTTVSVFGRTLPCSGGGYFRLLPYAFSRWALGRVNARDGKPGIFYFHPWEIDPDQPRIAGASWKSRLRHYTNLAGMERRLARVAAEFAWDRMDRVFLDPAR